MSISFIPSSFPPLFMPLAVAMQRPKAGSSDA
jgi:hypothetical protein